MSLSRLWKLEGDETLDDVKERLADLNNDMSKLPLAVQASLLRDELMIDDANVANDELIIMEMKITFDPNAEMPYVYAPSVEKRKRVYKESKLPDNF